MPQSNNWLTCCKPRDLRNSAILVSVAVGVVLFAGACGLFTQQEESECASINEAVFKKITEEPPLSALPAAALAVLKSQLPKGGKVCLRGPGSKVMCNKAAPPARQGAEAPPHSNDACCKFTADPALYVIDLPDKITYTTGVGDLAVTWIDITLKGIDPGMKVRRLCVDGPKMCQNDAASAWPHLRVEGKINNGTGVISVGVSYDLKQKVVHYCSAP